MKKIEAIIKPFKLEAVKEALFDLGINGMTVTGVRGFGRQHGHHGTFRGRDFQVDLVPKTKLEIVVPDELADKALAVILDAALTGDIGDGKVFVHSIESAVRIRTKETSDIALV